MNADYILYIDTALTLARVGVSGPDGPMAWRENAEQKDHAAFLQPAVKEVLAEAGLKGAELKAVAVVYGPGSYTGLRVGMAGSKGLCYAWGLPLLTIGTLELLVEAARVNPVSCTWMVPMIDARRMEVFSAIYDREGTEVRPVRAEVLDKDSYAEYRKQGVWFFGNGMPKWRDLLGDEGGGSAFDPVEYGHRELSRLAHRYYEKRRFADLAYVEPLYGKGFFTPGRGGT